jgi:hypothetical protein
VAAVFEAFLTIYKWRIADLLRLASGGSGVCAAGELHGRSSDWPRKRPRRRVTLHICIRPDYCPPVDVEFGDYLQAIITAMPAGNRRPLQLRLAIVGRSPARHLPARCTQLVGGEPGLERRK